MRLMQLSPCSDELHSNYFGPNRTEVTWNHTPSKRVKEKGTCVSRPPEITVCLVSNALLSFTEVSPDVAGRRLGLSVQRTERQPVTCQTGGAACSLDSALEKRRNMTCDAVIPWQSPGELK